MKENMCVMLVIHYGDAAKSNAVVINMESIQVGYYSLIAPAKNCYNALLQI